MRGKCLFTVLIAALLMSACASRPEQELSAARQAVEKARQAEADVYAPEEFQAATRALESAEAEIATQDERSFLTRDYERAQELLSQATNRANAAVQTTEPGRAEARQQAEAAQRDAEAALEEARGAMADGPRGKGTRADREALEVDLRAAETSFSDGQDGYRSQRYADALNQFRSAIQKAQAVSAAFERAGARARRVS
jgi:hypothetical protein